ncbi:MAG: polymerase beta, Nucleotidyltransferase [Deinococcota bacterium]|jgi:predicted nucleotidyltransferase
MNQLSKIELQEIAQIMANASGASKIILFGSRARGDFDSSSDWDFLLVMRDSDWKWDGDMFEKLEPAMLAKDALYRLGRYYPMDVLPMAQKRFAEPDSLLATEVKRDGIVLFDAEVNHA